ncbi:hypothetical protein DPMN_040658 [Dreissena polymorpha]|uniref:Uncharacterized protein n=1 Tax=Dreissena polymorpha TaxID=45954 RepID=A0A9D4CX56_DREPO|nr:hypothetical protein DPMN_040658 [Dreissena polymorpha]
MLYPADSDSDRTAPVFDLMAESHPDITTGGEGFEQFVRELFSFLRTSILNVLENQIIITKRLDEYETKMGRAENLYTERSKSIEFAHKR